MSSLTADTNTEEFNIFYRSKDQDSSMLSRFFLAPYVVMDDAGGRILVASSEAFLQGIAFHEDDPRREQCFELHGPDAWRFGQKSPRDGFVYFSGEAIKYRSPDYYALLWQSEREKFLQNEECRKALLRTKGKKLVHRIRGRNMGGSFVDLLERIREELS